MSDSKLATNIIKLVNNSAKLSGKLQNGVNKILWGSANTQPTQTAVYNTNTQTLDYSFSSTSPTPPKTGNLVESGLFNALDILNEVDLCGIVTYLTDNINSKKKARPEKPWNATQTAFYGLQDKAAFVQEAIDKFTAFPNIFIGSYIGTGPNAVPPQQAISQSNAPAEGGSQVTAYNLYFLMQSIKDTFSFDNNTTSSLFTAEDKTLLSTVPGLGGNLNIIDDFIGTINKYSDYRQIPSAEVQRLVNKVTTVRSVCVAIQNLDFKAGLAAVGNFLGVDIRAQIQKLNKYLDATKLIPTLKAINSSLQSFIRTARQVEGILKLGQFLIKLALIFNKVFVFVKAIFDNNPLPLITATSGIQTRLQNARELAKTEGNGIARLLKAINALLTVILNFIRYLLVNANELLSRLRILLANLEACQAVKNSDVIAQLKQTELDLIALRDDLAAFITQYDSKTNANNTMFGKYNINVVDEEVTDPSIRNKRRRGIALDINSSIVAQSDLTFATNTAVIVAEVQQKLVALNLVSSNMSQIDAANIATIAESVNYLDSNDVVSSGLTVDSELVANIETLNAAGAAQAENITSFTDKLPGGPKFKQTAKDVTVGYSKTAEKTVKNQTTTLNDPIGTTAKEQATGTLTTLSGSINTLSPEQKLKQDNTATDRSSIVTRLKSQASGGSKNSQNLK
jgi:hypothetical protein